MINLPVIGHFCPAKKVNVTMVLVSDSLSGFHEGKVLGVSTILLDNKYLSPPGSHCHCIVSNQSTI